MSVINFKIKSIELGKHIYTRNNKVEDYRKTLNRETFGLKDSTYHTIQTPR